MNVITGHNGAGKSSMLLGIVLGLGGTAKHTKRLGNMKSAVKHDCHRAEIRLTLNNKGEDESDGFKRDVYGDEIVLERIIYASNGQTENNVKDQHGRVVYKER